MLLNEKFDFRLSWRYTGPFLIKFFIISTVIASANYFFQWKWMQVPFLPIGMLGTAVAFFIGFKNNSAYDRYWEARKLWGSITNLSRTLSLQAIEYFGNNNENKTEAAEVKSNVEQFLRRHIAYVHCLRKHLRSQEDWFEINKYISQAEYEELVNKQHKPNYLISKQAKLLSEMKHSKQLDHFFHIDLMQSIKELLDAQGGCERLKNTPFPRQIANYSRLFTVIFTYLLPFAIATEFIKAFGIEGVWWSIPFSTLLCWMFMTMETIGHNTEKPFAVIPAAVALNSITTNIERDVLELLGEKELPKPEQAFQEVLM